jgi:hypothetical protein
LIVIRLVTVAGLTKPKRPVPGATFIGCAHPHECMINGQGLSPRCLPGSKYDMRRGWHKNVGSSGIESLSRQNATKGHDYKRNEALENFLVISWRLGGLMVYATAELIDERTRLRLRPVGEMLLL